MHITSTDDDWFKLVLWRKKSTFLLFEKIYRYRDEVFALQFNHLKQKVNLCELRVKRRKLTTAATIGYIPKTPFGLISSPEQNFQTSWRSGLKKVACVDSPWKKESEKECVWVKRECVWEGERVRVRERKRELPNHFCCHRSTQVGFPQKLGLATLLRDIVISVLIAAYCFFLWASNFLPSVQNSR